MTSIVSSYFRFLVFFVTAIASSGATAQTNRDNVTITTAVVRPNIHMLSGAGGNVAVLTGDQGVLIVDDQYEDMALRIDAAIAELTDLPVYYVLNTHWHPDHAGGNVHYGRQGKIIVAHDNTYDRMSVDQYMKVIDYHQPASPKEALPVITFSDSSTIRFNDETIKLTHVPDAHTDTDVFVQFMQANVIHSGDVYITARYPFIDTSTGGSLSGMITALEQLAALANARTTIIPGHGALSDKAGVEQTLAMLKALQHKLQLALDADLALEDFLATKPLDEFDATFARSDEHSRTFATRVYNELRATADSP